MPNNQKSVQVVLRSAYQRKPHMQKQDIKLEDCLNSLENSWGTTLNQSKLPHHNLMGGWLISPSFPSNLFKVFNFH